jgi:hypothetical protein
LPEEDMTQAPHQAQQPPQPSVQAPDLQTGNQVLDAYAESFASGDTPLLGHLVLYSVFDGQVTRDGLARWFTELGLDPKFLPPVLRPVDAFEKVTGPDGVRVAYPLDDPAAYTAAGKPQARRRRRDRDATVRSATLMVRPVRRDGGQIVRHVVREVRDQENTRLSYDTRIGVCVFHRDNDSETEGDGILQVEPDRTAIGQLPPPEQDTVRAMLADIEDSYRHRCQYLSADKLRSVIRTYIEHLNAIRVRPTGGVYFIHRQHATTLAALRELVARFGAGSHLARIPLPDQDEMRQMVIGAFTTKAKDDLDKLAADIAAAQRDHKTNQAEKLYHRFTELHHATTEHATLLSTTLEDTQAALKLVKMQLGGLLATATDDEQSAE